jgi:hypothetical protein
MKILIAIFLACISCTGNATTTLPVQLLNPNGSTSGQTIISAGPTTAPAWGSISAAAIGALSAANNLSDVNSSSLARSNLGLGSSATINTGTSGATVPLLNGANTWSAAQAFSLRPTFNGATPWDSTNLSVATSLTGYTPTVTATSGSFTTASASGRYFQIGKLTFFEVTVTITTVGMATGGVVVTLPTSINSGSGVVVFSGRENGVSGKMLQAYGSSSSVTIVNYDGTSPIAAGTSPVVSGVYVAP